MVELPQRKATVRSAVGGLIWIGLVCWRPSSPFDVGWARQLLLFSPLILVPLVVDLAERRDDTSVMRRLLGLANWLQLPAAVALVVAVEVLAQGSVAAAACTLPWLLVTGLLGLVGLLRAWRRGGTPWPELAVDAGLIFLPIGGGWALLHVLGEQPLGFKPVIVLLTAIHFHYAGLVLPVITGLSGRRLPGGFSSLVAAGVTIGVPLVAVGITSTQLGGPPAVETLSAWMTAAAAIGTSVLLLRLVRTGGVPLASKVLWTVSAVSLSGAMVLAALYGARAWLDLLPESWQLLPVPLEDPSGKTDNLEVIIDWMRAWHGTANAIGFALCSCLAWTIVERGSVFEPAAQVLTAKNAGR